VLNSKSGFEENPVVDWGCGSQKSITLLKTLLNFFYLTYLLKFFLSYLFMSIETRIMYAENWCLFGSINSLSFSFT
jgi:hypothetical protein